MDKPLVSVVIPVYNGQRFLAQAIESVLGQSYAPCEIIVVDDGSSDGSAAIAQSFAAVHCVRQENQGQAAALNAGVKASQGTLLAFLDADDMWTPNNLDIQVDYLLRHPGLGYVIGRTLNFVEPGTQAPAHLTKDLLPGLSSLLSPGAIVVRKAIFEQVGYFSPDYEHAKDMDWFVRAKEAGVIMKTLSETVLHRRIHGLNQSFRTTPRTTDYIRVLKASLDRKRAMDAKASLKSND